MFRRKKEESIDPAQFQQFLAFQAAMNKGQSEKKKKPRKQQAKPGAKRKGKSKLKRVVLLLLVAGAGLVVAFHYIPLFFIELFEAL
jgi:hypothetical protein